MILRLEGRARRKRRIRNKVSGSRQRPRLSVFRSHKQIYAQVIDDESGRTLAAVNSLKIEKPAASAAAVEVKSDAKAEGGAKPKQDEGKKDKEKKGKEKKEKKISAKIAMARAVGAAIADACKKKGIQKVVFDRSGYLYHGRVKALAEAARKAGLEF